MTSLDRIMLLSIIRKISNNQQKIDYNSSSYFTADESMWMLNNKDVFDSIRKKFLSYVASHRSGHHDIERLLCRLRLSDRLIR